MNQTNDLRPAIAMIELIFAIVIMGIVMMSAPMLISTAGNSTSVVLQQEGINQAVSRITMILSYPWDEANTNDSCIPPALGVTTNATVIALGPINTTTDPSRRVGVPLASNSRKFNSCGADLNASALGADSGDLDDIDDFDGTSSPLASIQNAGGRYIGKDSATIATTISYGSDTADYSGTTITFVPGTGTATSNIKNIDVTVSTFSSDADLNSSIIMHAFSCNIGGIAYERRQLP